MRIAVAQFAAGMDTPANLEKTPAPAGRGAEAGAGVAFFPEGAMCDWGKSTDELHGRAEPLDGRFVHALSELAARSSLTLVAGMFESIPGDRLIYNSAVVVDPGKGVIGAYRKHHLFDAFGEIESERFRAGREDPLLVEIDGFVVAEGHFLGICIPCFIVHAAGGGPGGGSWPGPPVGGAAYGGHLRRLACGRGQG